MPSLHLCRSSNMTLWGLPLALLVFALAFCVTVYQHIRVASLHLPFPPLLTSLPILLVPLACFNSLSLFFRRAPSPFSSSSSSSYSPVPPYNSSLYRPRRNLLSRLLPSAFIFQVLQLVLATVLATLFLREGAPFAPESPLRGCLLETRWQRLWAAHDADAIRRVQDALACCGLRAVNDRAWPFPHGPSDPGRPQNRACAEQYGRATACLDPWERAMRASGVAEAGAVLAMALVQVVGVWVARFFFAEGGSTGESPVRRLGGGRELGQQQQRRRQQPLPRGGGTEAGQPLLGAGEPGDGGAGDPGAGGMHGGLRPGEDAHGDGDTGGGSAYGGTGGGHDEAGNPWGRG